MEKPTKPQDIEAPAPAEADAVQNSILAKLEQLENRLMASESEKEAYRQMVEELTDLVEERRAAEAEDMLPAAEILYDPYYSKDPYMIVGSIEPDQQFPKGRVVAWKNFRLRMERRGWRGWVPFQYGDELTGDTGEHLTKYIMDPPPRLEGAMQLDSYVRRADLVLAWIDRRIFDARQRQRELETQRQVMAAGSAKTQILRDGVEVVGDGLKTQARPKGGFRMGSEKPVLGEHFTTFPVIKE
jgi:hypothetical protein